VIKSASNTSRKLAKRAIPINFQSMNASGANRPFRQFFFDSNYRSPRDFNRHEFPSKTKKNLFSRFSRIFLLGQFFCNSISICVSVLRWSPSRGKLRLINDNLSVDLDDNELLKIAQWFDLISSVKGSRIESFGSFLFGIP
jgi:hypothetical protein